MTQPPTRAMPAPRRDPPAIGVVASALLVLGGVCGRSLAAPPPAAVPAARAELMALADARRFDAQTLATLAGHPEAAVRAAVAAVLGELAHPGAVGVLSRLATDADADVRAGAAEAIGRLGAVLPAAVHEREALAGDLHRLLADPAAGVRSAAAWGAGMARLPGCDLWMLQRLGREKDPGVQAAILQELWRLGGTLWIRRATTFVSSRDPAVRLAATWSLARSGRLEAVAGLRQAARDADPLVRMVALEGARRGKAASLWGELLDGVADGDARVRIAALEGLAVALRQELGRTLPPAAVVTVERLVADGDPNRVQERVVAIRLAGAARCGLGALKAAVAGGEPWVAGEALIALAQHGDPAGEAAVRDWAASADPARRLAAVRAFRYVNGGQAQLLGALADREVRVRLVALDALGEDSGAAVTTAITQRLADSDPAVRAAAVDALAARKAAPPVEELLRLIARERDAAMPDAAVSLVTALGAGELLPDGARAALEGLAASADPVVARAAWEVLAKHGFLRPLPELKTGEDLAFYSGVVRWAGLRRWLEITTVRGTMQVLPDTTAAPLTCFRLAALADKKFFDGLTVHRVEPDFVVQGGDPRGDGWGGPGFVLRDELSVTPFDAGAVGLALSGPDTGGSQLFVTLTPRPHLLGRYPRIGRLAAGLEVAQRLRVGDKILRIRAGEGALPTYFPVWYGVLDPARLDREISGWGEERAKYKPEKKWLTLLRSAKLRYTLTVAMGTWCSDSHEQIPRLQAVLEALGHGSPFDPAKLIGVDRTKIADPILYPFGPIELVPTIVVTAGGSEIGRIVESPKSGHVEEDLARILAPIEGWQVPDA